MIVADTSVWIEYLKQSDPVTEHFRFLLERRLILGVECVFAELLQGARTKRERDLLLMFWKNIAQADKHEIWIKAGIFASERKLSSQGVGLVDATILLSARQHKARLWTLDKKLLRILDEGEIYLAY